ncbi:hypothetical protein FQA39_LY00634 [Lamprigera yunnana]|nr:hypothetical protein FQA39_LY00634 [Lamprigera yunnana]
MPHLRSAFKFSQEEIKLKMAVYTVSSREGLTGLSAKTDMTGLIGAKWTCINNSLRTFILTKVEVEVALESTCFQKRSQRQVESSEARGASAGSVKLAFKIYGSSLYLLKFPVYNLPLTQAIIDAVIRRVCIGMFNVVNTTIRAVIF